MPSELRSRIETELASIADCEKILKAEIFPRIRINLTNVCDKRRAVINEGPTLSTIEPLDASIFTTTMLLGL